MRSHSQLNARIESTLSASWLRLGYRLRSVTQYLIGLFACSVPFSVRGSLRFYLSNSSSPVLLSAGALGLMKLSIALSMSLERTFGRPTTRGKVLYCAHKARKLRLLVLS
jgi:hypothetical protein